jgi:WD40 repeat protein
MSFWSFPDLKKKAEVSAKILDEILDIAFVDKSCFFITAKALVACDLNGVVLKEVGVAEGYSLRCLQTFDGQVIAIGNSKDRKHCLATFYSASDLSHIKTLPIRSLRAVTCVAQSGDFIVLGSASGALGLFRISDFKPIKVIDNYHGFAITSLAITQYDSSSMLIFSGSTDSTIRMVKMPTKPSSSFLTLLLIFLALLALAIAVMVSQYPDRTQEIVTDIYKWYHHLLQEFKQHPLIK